MTLSLLTSLPLSLLSPSVPTATTVRMAASTATTVCDVFSMCQELWQDSVIKTAFYSIQYLTEEVSAHNGLKIVYSINGVGKIGQIHAEK